MGQRGHISQGAYLPLDERQREPVLSRRKDERLAIEGYPRLARYVLHTGLQTRLPRRMKQVFFLAHVLHDLTSPTPRPPSSRAGISRLQHAELPRPRAYPRLSSLALRRVTSPIVALSRRHAGRFIQRITTGTRSSGWAREIRFGEAFPLRPS